MAADPNPFIPEDLIAGSRAEGTNLIALWIADMMTSITVPIVLIEGLFLLRAPRKVRRRLAVVPCLNSWCYGG